MASLTSLVATGTASSDTLPTILDHAMGAVTAGANRDKKKLKQGSILAETGKGKVTVMTQTEAYRIFKSQFKTIMSRYESPSHLFDHFNLASLLVSHPAIRHFVPRTSNTVYTDYCVGIDTDSMNKLIGLIKNQPGLLLVALDGVTNHCKSKTLITTTIGCVSMFVK